MNKRITEFWILQPTDAFRSISAGITIEAKSTIQDDQVMLDVK